MTTKQETFKKNIETAIENLGNKDFTFYFFVVDSKDIPNGSMFHSYQLAKALQDGGYNVKMLYQLDLTTAKSLKEEGKISEEDMPKFVGVGEWLGSEYSDIPHINIAEVETKFTPSDIVIVPDQITSFLVAMRENNIVSRCYILVNNTQNLLSALEIGDNLEDYTVDGFITTNSKISDELNVVYPNIKSFYCPIQYNTKVESISKDIKELELVIGVYSSNERYVKSLVNTFYALNPEYRFITFSMLRMLNHQEYKEQLSKNAIFVWEDGETLNGVSLKEALSTNSFVFAVNPRCGIEYILEHSTEQEISQEVILVETPVHAAKMLGMIVNAILTKPDFDNINKLMNARSEKYKGFGFNVQEIGHSVVENSTAILKTIIDNEGK